MRKVATDSKPEQPHKGSRRLKRIVLLTVLGIVGYASVIAWDQQGKLDALSVQVNALNEKRAETGKLNEQYKKEVERLNDPEYLLQKIRKEYHYTKPGETLFYTPKS
ncbi:FtsB family cell division protein [Paenibacillus koleovorans]|uniref:FtsB family cell division protein n=1 Tax=Paenibacillus koleovorans TaxID=121608 RepID=UPI000FD9D772|nr:septum formation initiator family protein [Paenibacillus koleovorans]